MTKRLWICFLIALTYFFIAIPVLSEYALNESGGNLGIEITQSNKDQDMLFSGVQNVLSPETTGQISGKIEPETFIEANQTNSGTIKMINTTQQITGVLFITNEINSGSDSTGQISGEITIPQLIISEVYYDGTEEWIEITNLGSSFSGLLQLNVPQSLSFAVQISQGESIIVAKGSLAYLWISPLVKKIQISSSFSFTDTKAISINLLRSGQLLDYFDVETGWVTNLNDKKTSFSKIKNNQIWSITGTRIAINVTGQFFATPGMVEDATALGEVTMTGHVETQTPTFPQPGILDITEIYKGSGQFSSFIEIKAISDFSGVVMFSGSLLKESFSLETNLEKQEIIILVQFDNGWLSDQKKKQVVGLELASSGFLQILGQSGQVFDSTQILSIYPNKSVYYGGFSNGGVDIFSKIDDFSPGFEEKYLSYTRANCSGIIQQNISTTGSISQTASGVLSNSGIVNGQDLSGGINVLLGINWGDLMIVDLSFLSPERITIHSSLVTTVDLSKKDWYILTKDISSSIRKTTKRYLTGILNSGDSVTITKTFGFLDQGSCVGLFYQTTQIDEYCYNKTPTLQQISPQPLQTSGEQQISRIPHISIIGLLPNPIGKDDQEVLTLVFESSGESIQQIFNDKELYITVGKTKKYITGTLFAGIPQNFTGSLGLVNKAACLQLWYKTTQLDIYCYQDPKEGEYFEKGKEVDEDMISDKQSISPNIRILGLMPNPKGKDDKEQLVVIWSTTGIENNFVFQEKTRYLLNGNTKTYLSGILQGNLPKIFTGVLGLTNKANCTQLRYSTELKDQFCYPNPKEDEYFGTGNKILQTIQNSDLNILQKIGFLLTGNKICIHYHQQPLVCRNLPASKTSIKLKNENKLYKTYVGLIQNYLINNRSTLYFNTDIVTYFNVLKNAKAQVRKFIPIITISGQQLDVYDLSEQIRLKTATQGLSGTHIQEKYSWWKQILQRLGIVGDYSSDRQL